MQLAGLRSGRSLVLAKYPFCQFLAGGCIKLEILVSVVVAVLDDDGVDLLLQLADAALRLSTLPKTPDFSSRISSRDVP